MNSVFLMVFLSLFTQIGLAQNPPAPGPQKPYTITVADIDQHIILDQRIIAAAKIAQSKPALYAGIAFNAMTFVWGAGLIPLAEGDILAAKLIREAQALTIDSKAAQSIENSWWITRMFTKALHGGIQTTLSLFNLEGKYVAGTGLVIVVKSAVRGVAWYFISTDAAPSLISFMTKDIVMLQAQADNLRLQEKAP